MLRAAHEETRACDMHSLTSEPTHSRRTVEALWPALHPIHEVAAVLAGGRATPTTNSCAGNRDKAPRRKCSQFPELISSAAVAGTCRLHAIYEPTVYLCGESGRNCQVRLGAPSSPGDSRSHASNADLVLPVQYAHQAAPSRRGTISATFQLCPASFWRSRLIAT
jgi:hypothetical protein